MRAAILAPKLLYLGIPRDSSSSHCPKFSQSYVKAVPPGRNWASVGLEFIRAYSGSRHVRRTGQRRAAFKRSGSPTRASRHGRRVLVVAASGRRSSIGGGTADAQELSWIRRSSGARIIYGIAYRPDDSQGLVGAIRHEDSYGFTPGGSCESGSRGRATLCCGLSRGASRADIWRTLPALR